MSITDKLELPMSQAYFHGSIGIRAIEVPLYVHFTDLQSTLVILTSIISNNRLYRRENLVLVLT